MLSMQVAHSVKNGGHERHRLGQRKTLPWHRALHNGQVGSFDVVHEEIEAVVFVAREDLVNAGKGQMLEPPEHPGIERGSAPLFANSMHHLFEDEMILGVTLVFDEIDGTRCPLAKQIDYGILPLYEELDLGRRLRVIHLHSNDFLNIPSLFAVSVNFHALPGHEEGSQCLSTRICTSDIINPTFRSCK